MKLFETIRMNLAKCLYFPNQVRLFDTKRLLATFIAFLSVISHFLFLFFGAEKMTQYVISAFWTTTILGIFCSFVHTTIKTATIFVLIDCDIGELVKQSEFKLILF